MYLIEPQNSRASVSESLEEFAPASHKELQRTSALGLGFERGPRPTGTVDENASGRMKAPKIAAPGARLKLAMRTAGRVACLYFANPRLAKNSLCLFSISAVQTPFSL
jgi:hypothetical protein